jgi:hypothetical protein
VGISRVPGISILRKKEDTRFMQTTRDFLFHLSIFSFKSCGLEFGSHPVFKLSPTPLPYGLVFFFFFTTDFLCLDGRSDVGGVNFSEIKQNIVIM